MISAKKGQISFSKVATFSFRTAKNDTLKKKSRISRWRAGHNSFGPPFGGGSAKRNLYTSEKQQQDKMQYP